MVLDITQRKTNTRHQAVFFLEPKVWTKISHSAKNVKTTAFFCRGLQRLYFEGFKASLKQLFGVFVSTFSMNRRFKENSKASF